MKASGVPHLHSPACWAHNLSVVISCLSSLSTHSRPLQPCQDPAVIPNVYRATEPPTKRVRWCQTGIKSLHTASAAPLMR